ncbi:hypothetical protein HF086_017603 [Spodoptera exigua]|uniref:Mutant cadherin n=1 Tax=Spodoptera exigua TaxID=7107 RepID=A0A922MIG1_SPOEX|nr:hypothetical protein HF086_017603 [Spodoptera exigua]
MATKLLKCSTCNIVINEVLAFVNNKIDVMDEDSLARICISAFSESDILNAKNLLFESLSKKKKQRKRDGKTLRNIDDIICVLKETDPEEIPTFVARDLQKLPPVLFDHVDVTRILKDLLKLQQDVNLIKSNYVTSEQLEIIKCDIQKARQTSPNNKFENNVNKRRGACLLDSLSYNSGPMGLLPLCDDTIIEPSTSSPTPNSGYRDIQITQNQSAVQGNSIHRQNQRESGSRSAIANNVAAAVTQTGAGEVNHAPLPAAAALSAQALNTGLRHTDRQFGKTMADVTREGQWKPMVENEEWTLVQRKRLRNRFEGKRGNAVLEPDEKFKAADVKTPIYIYNVGKEVSENDIIEYIKKRASINVSVEKVNMKVSKDYQSYKVFVSKFHLDKILKDDFWPEGIAYRQYIQFRPRFRDQKTSTNGDN